MTHKEKIKGQLGAFLQPIFLDSIKNAVLVEESVMKSVSGEVLVKQTPTPYFRVEDVAKLLDLAFEKTYKLTNPE